MATSISPILETTWAKEAHIIFGQEKSRFHGKFRTERARSKTHTFTKFADVTANEGKSAQAADVTVIDHTATAVTTTAVVINVPLIVDDWDLAQTSVNYRDTLSKICARAVWAKYDDLAITAIGAGSSGEITMPSAGVLNYAGLNTLAASFDAADALGKRYGAVSATGYNSLRNDSNISNNYHFSNNVVKTGQIGDVSSFETLSLSNRLANGALGATEDKCLFWEEDAVGEAVVQDFKMKVAYIDMKQAHMVIGTMIVGFVAIDSTGIFHADITV